MSTFADSVKDHELQIPLDTGIYRHLIYKKPYSGDMGFNIVTVPQYLTICGDMGSYTFTRVADMFQFFRGDNINPEYWAQKCVSTDKHCDIKKYCEKKMTRLIMERVEDWCSPEWNDYSEEQRKQLENEIKEDVLPYIDTESMALDVLMDFDPDNSMFEDFLEEDVREFTPNFLWCLEAIVHTIKVYDETKKLTA